MAYNNVLGLSNKFSLSVRNLYQDLRRSNNMPINVLDWQLKVFILEVDLQWNDESKDVVMRRPFLVSLGKMVVRDDNSPL